MQRAATQGAHAVAFPELAVDRFFPQHAGDASAADPDVSPAREPFSDDRDDVAAFHRTGRRLPSENRRRRFLEDLLRSDDAPLATARLAGGPGL